MGYSVVAILVALVAVASADPFYFHGNPGYYPAVPYAYGYGGIPYSAPIHISLAKSAPVVSPYVAPVPVPVAPEPKKPILKLVDVQEATQFHSQDGRGQFLFGIPNQARIESRTSDGTVRGSYSYLDPVGRAITVQYVADDSGYHAASNELPASVPGSVPQPSQPSSYQQRVAQQYAASYPALVPASIVGQLPKAVEDSPDVAAAREAHLRAHQAALEAHAAALAAAEAGEGAEGATPLKTPVSVTNDSPSDEEDVGEQEEVDEEDDKAMDEADEGVVVESDALSDNSAGGGATSYEDDHELTYEKDRYPKLQYNSQQETYDPARVHDEANQAVIVNNPEFAESPVSTRIGSEGQENQAQGGAAFDMPSPFTWPYLRASRVRRRSPASSRFPPTGSTSPEEFLARPVSSPPPAVPFPSAGPSPRGLPFSEPYRWLPSTTPRYRRRREDRLRTTKHCLCTSLPLKLRRTEAGQPGRRSGLAGARPLRP
ncbi:uncharacterized protein LOC124161137 isoform X2 [Ischnura elegans]|uniref:uncharacterized protein LOC124161137 isoform X2 n=1 Tax=Ischnura elegans TaxID=197161 RepID=UPI001ED89143|nr:uncharacterized protein LOC124161137 isoform X2 [Ischnura elegans]